MGTEGDRRGSRGALCTSTARGWDQACRWRGWSGGGGGMTSPEPKEGTKARRVQMSM